ncbi:MAG: hypothetical protein CMJ18_08255 [Phycisphaeraceae bacterium]|nr:hypothetical protein [Phycisphaeraceae bacterium]
MNDSRNRPPVVVIAETLDPHCAEWLAARARVVRPEGRPLRELLADADGLVVRTYTRVDDGLLDAAPNLCVIGRAGVGLDNVDLDACRRRGIQVVYTPDANTQAVAEYVTALILDDLRPRTPMRGPVDAETFHRLRRTEVGAQLDELTIAIYGFGRIGKRVGRIASAIGMTVLTHDLIDEATLRPLVDYPFEHVGRDELLSRGDILTIHVDGRPGNRHLLDGAALSLMKRTALLVNAARGMLIDHAALRAWLDDVRDEGGRAVLDVHEPEPIPADHPLWHVDNALLLPHLASRTHTAMRNMSWVVRDVVEVLEGRKPRSGAHLR